MFFFKLWNAWENKNALPYKGAYTDQPSLLMELFELFDTMLSKIQKNNEANT